MNRRARRPAAALFAGLVVAAGCTRPNEQVKDAAKDNRPKTDPWEVAAKRLRKDTDAPAVRTALAQLSNELAARPELPAPPGLTPEAAAALAAVVPLSDADLDSLRPVGYGGLDPSYVADCSYLRDAARAIDPVGLPPADLARVGFAWVCRQVYLNPWAIDIRPGVQEATALPPTAVLRRGYGSGLERAYVFLALLQQLGIDGCLVGPPGAADPPAGVVAPGPDGKPRAEYPRGPFWAVGARVGGDILLFDPWRGLPFPAADGKGVGTLAQVKTNPDAIKAWLADPAGGVTAADARAAAVFLAVPVTALAPRIAVLDAKVKAETGVRLAVDPAALRDRFLAEAVKGPAFPAAAVRFWNPRGDRFAYGRTAATFLPPEEGGTDRAPPEHRLQAQYFRSLFPQTVFQLPGGLEPRAAERLFHAGVSGYVTTFLTPPTPRERVQRGQTQDATRYLIDRQDGFTRGVDRLRAADPRQVGEWVRAANAVYEGQRAARYPDQLQTQPQPDADPGVVAATAAVEEFWNAQRQTAQVVIDRSMARVGLAEASFLIALAKHEEAERQQVRAERATPGADGDRTKATAATAWAESANAWRSYLEQAASLPALPGRAAHAEALAARANALAGAK